MIVKEYNTIVTPVNVDERKTLSLKVGDTVRVSQKVKEKNKTRIQVFEGIIISRSHGAEPGATFTVRRVSRNIGVEKTFPLYSPNIDKIEVVRRTRVRRAKLYYLRDKFAKQIRQKMRRARTLYLATVSEEEQVKQKEDEKEDEKEVDERVEQVEQGKDNKEEANEKETVEKEAVEEVKEEPSPEGEEDVSKEKEEKESE